MVEKFKKSYACTKCLEKKLIILIWSTCIAFCIILCLNGYLCYIFTPSLKCVIIVSKLYQLKIIKTPSLLQYPNPTQSCLFTLALFKPLRNQIMEAADPLKWIQEEEWGREGFPVLSGPVFSYLLFYWFILVSDSFTQIPVYQCILLILSPGPLLSFSHPLHSPSHIAVDPFSRFMAFIFNSEDVWQSFL